MSKVVTSTTLAHFWSKLKTQLSGKVDVVDGKGLSTNDLTDDLLDKLNNIDEGANAYTLPIASSTLGGVKTTSTVTSTSGYTAVPIIGGIPYYKDTDTKNTAGSTDSSSKLFLVGATEQSANPQTYSHDTAYVGTDGHLYSNGIQVVNLSGTQALTNKTYNGFTLAAACAKAVADSTAANALTSNGTSLVTERDVYFGLPTINNAHNYTSSTKIYAPTEGGASGYILTANGANTTPTWTEPSALSIGTAASADKVANALTVNGKTYDGSSEVDVGTIDIPHGGTGATAAAGVLTNLGLTATAAELNIMDGVTATATEINKLDGLTTTTAELNYVDGVTSSIQTQLDNKAPKSHDHVVSAISDLTAVTTADVDKMIAGTYA